MLIRQGDLTNPPRYHLSLTQINRLDAFQKRVVADFKQNQPEESKCVEEIREILTKYQQDLNTYRKYLPNDAWWKFKNTAINDLLGSLQDEFISPHLRLRNFNRLLTEEDAVMVPTVIPMTGICVGGIGWTRGDILNTTRTSLGWIDTGAVVLKAIVAVLGTVSIFPTLAFKAGTRKFLHEHLFKIPKGEDALNKISEKQRVLAEKLKKPK